MAPHGVGRRKVGVIQVIFQCFHDDFWTWADTAVVKVDNASVYGEGLLHGCPKILIAGYTLWRRIGWVARHGFCKLGQSLTGKEHKTCACQERIFQKFSAQEHLEYKRLVVLVWRSFLLVMWR
jgi:hypothetical protein